jgi:hypothetical protein
LFVLKVTKRVDFSVNSSNNKKKGENSHSKNPFRVACVFVILFLHRHHLNQFFFFIIFAPPFTTQKKNTKRKEKEKS